MPVRATLLGAALALTTAALPAAPAVAARPAPPCLDLAFSPDFSRDRTVFCVYERGQDGAYLARSTNGGRSWGVGRRVGTEPYADHYCPAAMVSPWYAADARVLVTTCRALYESTDRGATFRRVEDDSDTHPGSTRRMTPYLDPGTGTTPARPAFVYATNGRGPRVYDTEGGARKVVGAIVEGSVLFLVPPDYVHRREAVVLAQASFGYYDENGKPISPRALRAYTCVGDFICARQHFDFGDAVYVHSAALGSPGSLVVVTRDARAGAANNVWRTADYGRTWHPWPSVNRLTAHLTKTLDYKGTVAMTASPDAPRRLFLHLVNDPPGKDPKNPNDNPQSFLLYRSDDDGTTWRRVASSTTARGGTLPWNFQQWFRDISLTAHPGGRLYATAARRVGGRVDYQGVFCSGDLGRTWRRGGGC